MSVGKESVILFEQLSARQHQIYPDAADVGLFDEEVKRDAIRAALDDLKQLEGGRTHRWLNGVSYTVRCGFETEGPNTNGVEITVSHHTPRRGRSFWSFDLKRSSWPTGQRLGSTKK